MRAVLLLSLVALAGCSLVEDDDPFEDAYLSVYSATLDWIEGVPPVTGRIGLTYYPSDVALSGDACTGPDGVYVGRWELDDPNDRIAEGEGSVRGGFDCTGETLRLYFFDGFTEDDSADDAVFYVVDMQRDGARGFVGTWERIGSYPRGAFSARLVREATDFPVVP